MEVFYVKMSAWPSFSTQTLDMDTSNLVIHPLFSSPCVEKIEEWEFFCELDGESSPVAALGTSTRPIEDSLTSVDVVLEILEDSSDDLGGKWDCAFLVSNIFSHFELDLHGC